MDIQSSRDTIIHGDIVGGDQNKTYNNIEIIIKEISAIEKTQSQLGFEEEVLFQSIIDYSRRLQTTAAVRVGGPYKGLPEYRLSDGAIFCGRNQVVQEFLAHLQQSPLTVLHAESGTGKTSLLKAGIMPHLLAAKQLPLYIRPYDVDPVLAVKQELVADLSHTPGLAVDPLNEFLRKVCNILGSRTLYVLLDQFEEFFVLLESSQQTAFLEVFRRCIHDASLNVCWVLSLRSEFYSDLANFDWGVDPFANQLRLNRLTRAEAILAIKKPAKIFGLQLTPELADLILDDLQEKPIDPTQVQLVCQTLWEELLVKTTEIIQKLYEGLDATDGILKGHLDRVLTQRMPAELRTSADPAQVQLMCQILWEEFPAETTEITQKLYEDLGSADGILKGHLNRVLTQRMPGELRAPARLLVNTLISADRRRVLYTRSKIIAKLTPRGASVETIDHVLRQLRQSRLLRVPEGDETSANPAYELTHDYLLDRIELTDQDKARKQVEELIDYKTENWRRDVKILFEKEELELIKSQQEALYLEPLALQLLVRSTAVYGGEPTYWAKRLNSETRQMFVDEMAQETHSAKQVQRWQAVLVLWSLRTYLPRHLYVSVARQYAFRRVLQTGQRWAIPLVVLGILLLGIVAFPFTAPVEDVRLMTAKVGDGVDLLIAHDPANPDHLLLSDPMPGGLWRSKDGGISFEPVGEGVLHNQRILQVATTQEVIYVVTARGVYVRRQEESSWQQIPLPDGFVPQVITVNQEVMGDVFVGGNMGIWHIANEENNGKYVSISDEMGTKLQAIAVAGGRLLVATEKGIWLRDGEQDWQKFPEEPEEPVTGLALPYGGKSYVFMIALADGSLQEADFKDSFQLYDRLYPFKLASISSLSATENAWYASTNLGLVCWRRWNILNINWWRFHLGAAVPCLSENPISNN